MCTLVSSDIFYPYKVAIIAEVINIYTLMIVGMNAGMHARAHTHTHTHMRKHTNFNLVTLQTYIK